MNAIYLQKLYFVLFLIYFGCHKECSGKRMNFSSTVTMPQCLPSSDSFSVPLQDWLTNNSSQHLHDCCLACKVNQISSHTYTPHHSHHCWCLLICTLCSKHYHRIQRYLLWSRFIASFININWIFPTRLLIFH